MSLKEEPECDIDLEIYKFPGRSKSFVWNHFGFQKGVDGQLDKSRAVCKICRHGIRYSGNTTNLHCHLTKHRRENSSLFPGMDESWMQIEMSPDTKYDIKYVESMVQSTVEDTKPGNSLSSTDDHKSTQRSKHQQLNDTIVNFFIEHLLPLSVIESTSFYSMIAVADPMYVLPDKEILFGNLIQQAFNEAKKSIELQLSDSEVITLAEIWESITGEKFVSISCQLINSLWQMKTFLLRTTSMNDIPSEDVFINVLKSTYSEWGIKGSEVLLNDGSKIMEKIFPSLQMVNMACCSKVLFIAGDNLIKNQTVTGSVVHFVISLIARILQNKYPLELYSKFFDIIRNLKEIDTKTFPWTTFSQVLQCIIENEEVIRQNAICADNLSGEIWQQVLDMNNIISPLLKAYTLLCDKSSVISSMILPVLRKLKVTFTQKKEDSEFIQVLKKATWQSISEPFRTSTVRNFLLISSLLDPRYKDLQFVDGPERLHAREILGTVATDLYREINRKGPKDNGIYDDDIIVVEESGDIIRIEPMEKRQKLSNDEQFCKKDDWLADVICKDKPIEKSEEKEEKVMIEIDHYISTAQVSTLPLQWWSSREGLYPTLSRLARRYLCMNNLRISENQTVRNARLSRDNVDRLLVLHHHYYCQ